MLDPNFVRSVTLICQHSDEGAIGITINRLSDFTLGEILQQIDIPCQDPEILEARVLEGGPVNVDRGFVLHSPTPGFESSLEVSPEIMVTTSRDVLTAIAEGRGPENYVVALGYAGWGDGQLESEMRENAWLSVPIDSAIVFDLPLEERWQTAVSRLGIDVSHLHQVGGHA
ncbi:MAG: YqgE/AlgH family protein, partial [Xanthomonadales bacterium]|nr:YqgE/AlgH family protein [Xanthomonadales bacterium]NIQ97307.1 YqgE/AlgH family protein [Desulfuromonadales bacterium]NIX12158.1 YqgE/AlgH family protein [Xanthomonadales bacterium]